MALVDCSELFQIIFILVVCIVFSSFGSSELTNPMDFFQTLSFQYPYIQGFFFPFWFFGPIEPVVMFQAIFFQFIITHFFPFPLWIVGTYGAFGFVSTYFFIYFQQHYFSFDQGDLWSLCICSNLIIFPV